MRRLLAVGVAVLALAGCGGPAGSGGSTSGSEVGGGAGAEVAFQHFTNSRANVRNTQLLQHYIDFEFNYPQGWRVTPETGTAQSQNFVKVVIKNEAGSDMESFGVGTFYGTGNPAQDRSVYPQVVQQISSQFASSFPNYRLVDQGDTQVGPYAGYQFRFTARVTPQGRDPIDVWGRAIMIPGPVGQTNGAFLILIASSASDQVHGLNDVGVRGQLTVPLNSFRFTGASAVAAPQPAQPAQMPAPQADAQAPANPYGGDASAPQPDEQQAPQADESGQDGGK